jgi:DNA-binding CsgD family transcriptional regulator/tetratricopeptide (TPR) repeat protein
VRAASLATARAIPFGAIAHLLPKGADPGSPVALFAQFVEHYLADEERIVVFIDDLHLLDATSWVLIGQLLDSGRAFLIGTLRTGPFPGGPATTSARADQCRIDLVEFSLDMVHSLLHRVLGGPVEPGMAVQLHQVSGGVLLFLRELVQGAMATGALIGDGGMWRLTGPPMGTPRLDEVIERHLSAVSDDDRQVLEVISLCAPMGTHGLDPAALSRLERAKLIHIQAEQRRVTVSIAHPLYGEILRSKIPQHVRQGILTDHARRIQGTGMRRREDRLQVTMCLLNATGTAAPDLLVQAARQARFARDFESMLHLSSALARTDRGAGPRMLRGEALYELGRFDEADTELREAASAAADDDEYLMATLLHTQSLAWGAARMNEAIVVNQAAWERLTARGARDALTVDRTAIFVHIGDVGRALPLLPSLANITDPRTRVMSLPPRAVALVDSGRVGEALEVTRDAYAEHARIPAVTAAAHPALQHAARVYALVESGQVADARQLGERAYREAAADKALIAQLWIAIEIGRTELVSGMMACARTWFTTAATLATDHGFRSASWAAFAGLALAAAGMGDLPLLDEAWRQCRDLSPEGERRADVAAVPGWRLAARGRLREAREALGHAVDLARETGSLITEARLLTDIARLGDPSGARRRLAELATQTDGALTSVRATFADALSARNPGRLEEVARRLEAMGVLLLAAEARTRAAELYTSERGVRKAKAALQRARQLAATCEGASTAVLSFATDEAPLTAREREIAILAMQGLSSKELAEQLVLSVRTVDNHLQRIYRKTGIRRRKDLIKILQPGL